MQELASSETCPSNASTPARVEASCASAAPPLTAQTFGDVWNALQPWVRKVASRRLAGAGYGRALASVRGAVAVAACSGVLTSASSVRAGVVGDNALLEDVVQEVALALWEHVLRTPEAERVRAVGKDLRRWLSVTTRQVAWRLGDRAARFGFSLGEEPAADDAADEEGTASAPTEARSRTPSPELGALLCELVAPLDKRDRYVFAAAVEGQNHQDVAERLGVTPCASRLRRFRVLRELARKAA